VRGHTTPKTRVQLATPDNEASENGSLDYFKERLFTMKTEIAVIANAFRLGEIDLDEFKRIVTSITQAMEDVQVASDRYRSTP
jgi:hypothetical protein